MRRSFLCGQNAQGPDEPGLVLDAIVGGYGSRKSPQLIQVVAEVHLTIPASTAVATTMTQ